MELPLLLRSSTQRKTRKVLGTYLLWALAVFLLWRTPLLGPLRYLATTVHELGHMVMAVVSGARILDLQVDPTASGYVVHVGGEIGLVAPAGYLATIAVALLFLWASGSEGGCKVALWCLVGVLVLTIGLVSGGFGVALALGALLLWAGACLWLGWEWLQAATVRVVAVSLLMHGVWDLLVLIRLAERVHNDAANMAQAYGLTPRLWAMIWLGASVIILVGGLWVVAWREVRQRERDSLPSRIHRVLKDFKKGDEGTHRIR